MHTLSAAELLNTWEWGLHQQLPQRALSLLAAACPDTTPEELAQLTIGERDARLLHLRASMFGTELTSVAACPSCQQPLELGFGVEQVRSPTHSESNDTRSFVVDAYEITLRLPNSLDLLAVAGAGDLPTLRLRLLERCVAVADCAGNEQPLDQLPEHVLTSIADHVGEADPQANVQLALACPACAHRWEAVFDIVSFLWSEIDAWARRLLREVHALALAYGWREADVLSMSPLRRQLYLQMAGT